MPSPAESAPGSSDPTGGGPAGDPAPHDASLRDGKRLRQTEQGYWSEEIPSSQRDALLSSVVNAANTMISLSRRGEGDDDPLIYVNRYFCEFTGYEPEEILGRDCRFLQFRDGERVVEGNEEPRKEMRQALRTGEFSRLTLRNFKKGGEEFRNELYLSPVEGEDGRVGYFVGVQNDTTERDATIERLRESEASLTAVLAASPVALALTEVGEDGRARHLRVNPAAAELLTPGDGGPDPNRCVGRSLTDLGVPGPLADWLRDTIGSVAAGELDPGPHRTRLDQVVRAERRNLAVAVAAVETNPGEPPRFCYTVEDLTNFDAAEAERTLLRAAVRQIDVPTAILDDELDPPGPTILHANAALAALTGRPPGDLSGRLLTDLDGPVTDEAAAARMRRSLRETGAFRGDSAIYAADGTPIMVEWNVSAIRDADGRATNFAATLRDVRARRELERQVLQAQTREQARIARDLHDGVAQQLAGLNMLCGTLKRQAAAGEDISEVLDGIAGAVADAARDLRGVAHGLMPLDPRRGGLVAGLKRLAENTADLTPAACRFESPGGEVAVENPETAHHLYRIAQEAVGNAVRHGRAKAVTLTLAADGPDAALTIADDGGGFDPAAAAKEDGGMGLAGMRFRAQAVGGRLDLESREAGGTRVVCRFPNPAG